MKLRAGQGVARYVLLHLLGSGGTAEVWEARHQSLGPRPDGRWVAERGDHTWVVRDQELVAAAGGRWALHLPTALGRCRGAPP